MNVINLAAVSAVRKAAACTFEINAGLRRPTLSDIVSIGATCDYDTGKELFALVSDLRAASLDAWACRMPVFDLATGQRKADATPMPPVEFELEASGKWWLEAYMTYGHALQLQQDCFSRGIRMAS